MSIKLLCICLLFYIQPTDKVRCQLAHVCIQAELNVYWNIYFSFLLFICNLYLLVSLQNIRGGVTHGKQHLKCRVAIPNDNSTWWVSSTFRVFILHFFGTFIMTCSLWRKEIIPVHRLWLHGFYGLHGRRCPMSEKPNHPLLKYSEIDVHPRTANEKQHCYGISISVWNVSLVTFNFKTW